MQGSSNQVDTGLAISGVASVCTLSFILLLGPCLKMYAIEYGYFVKDRLCHNINSFLFGS